MDRPKTADQINREAGIVIYPNEYPSLYKDEGSLELSALIKAAIAERDKWWIEKIENQRDNICCVGEETTKCHLADPCCSFMRKSCDWWQNLKKEVLG